MTILHLFVPLVFDIEHTLSKLHLAFQFNGCGLLLFELTQLGGVFLYAVFLLEKCPTKGLGLVEAIKFTIAFLLHEFCYYVRASTVDFLR